MYDDRILAPTIARVLDTGHCRKHRSHVVPAATGDIVELGFGAGNNLPFYSDQVRSIHAVEPSEGARRLARRRLPDVDIPVYFDGLDGQNLPYPDESFDTCVTTWTMCSIPDPVAALREVKRVLRPGGRLLFLEHGAHPDSSVERTQRRLEPFWKKVAGGCHLSRPIDRLVTDAGFDIIELEHHTMPGPRFANYLYEGTAVIPAGSA